MTRFRVRGPLFGTNSLKQGLIHMGHVKPFLRPKLTVEPISGIKNATRCLVFEILIFPIVKPYTNSAIFRHILLEKKINLLKILF